MEEPNKNSISLGGNIELNGFQDIENAKLVVLKKIIGNYVKQIQEKKSDYEKCCSHSILSSSFMKVVAKFSLRSGLPAGSPCASSTTIDVPRKGLPPCRCTSLSDKARKWLATLYFATTIYFSSNAGAISGKAIVASQWTQTEFASSFSLLHDFASFGFAPDKEPSYSGAVVT